MRELIKLLSLRNPLTEGLIKETLGKYEFLYITVYDGTNRVFALTPSKVDENSYMPGYKKLEGDCVLAQQGLSSPDNTTYYGVLHYPIKREGRHQRGELWLYIDIPNKEK